jgi:alkanesulfonate monooxygenase SsuD/methylene tetrahydromethanopterin reductase-like flavin-dependent oxidoreductase (luciferase family)
MDYGLILPTISPQANVEGILAGAEVAQRVGWSTVWATDHIVEPASESEGAVSYEAIAALAYIGGRFPGLKLGLSVLCMPLRNALITAKQLATLDAMSGGRLTVGVGVGDADDLAEFGWLGVSDRYHHRGAYVDETIRLWRHLWSGSAEPFDGRFFQLRDYYFGPVPAQRDRLPIVVGGRSAGAYRRAGALSDGFHVTRFSASQLAEVVPDIRAAAERAGRPMPPLSARVRISFDGPPYRPYTIAGSIESMRAEMRAYRDLGVQHLALQLEQTEPDQILFVAERLQDEVLSAV